MLLAAWIFNGCSDLTNGCFNLATARFARLLDFHIRFFVRGFFFSGFLFGFMSVLAFLIWIFGLLMVVFWVVGDDLVVGSCFFW